MSFQSGLARACGAALMLAVPGAAYAQAPRLPAFRPEVSFGIVFDDNVFSRSTPEGDIFMRLTPGFDLRHETRQLNVGAALHFDAERYQERPDLNTPVARQNTTFDLTWRPNGRFAFIGRAGYQRTQTPQDLNVTSGLAGGRQEASRVDFGIGVEQTIRPRHRLSIGGDFGHDDIRVGTDTNIRTARVRYSHQVSGRTDMFYNYRFEQREFLPGPTILSHVATVGWGRRLSRAFELRLEGGLRVADGKPGPEVLITGTRAINGITSLMLMYAHTQDVAAGVVGMLTIDRVGASMTMRRGRFWEFTTGGGAYRNVQGGSDTIAYDAMVSVGRALGNAVWLVGSANRSWNNTRVIGRPVPNTEILRNWAMVSIRVAPWRPR